MFIIKKNLRHINLKKNDKNLSIAKKNKSFKYV